MSSAISRIAYLLRFKAMIFFALTLLTVAIVPHESSASVYSVPPYTNPDYVACRGTPAPGCCDDVPGVVRGMFRKDFQQDFYIGRMFSQHVEVGLKKLTDEFRNAMLFYSLTMGSMMDAQDLNQTLLSLQKQTTSSVVSQAPSNQICRFGTLSRSLAQSDDNARVVQLGLSNQMMRRQMMHDQMASAFEAAVGNKLGRTSDKIFRFNEYKKSYCDPKDSNGVLETGWCTSTSDTQRNKDIEITRSLYNPLTLKLDFTPTEIGNMTADEQDIIALGNNLFAHDLPVNMEWADFKGMTEDNSDLSEGRKEKLMDYRSLTAKRSIAQNSFAALAAMKAAGSTAASLYLKTLVADLGLSVDDQNAFLGQNPSYNAQMELLTRKIYQSPAFYANLMESNPNITRQQTAMEGIGLMQDRDIYESLHRSEMVLSTLLEMYVMRDQDGFKDRGTK